MKTILITVTLFILSLLIFPTSTDASVANWQKSFSIYPTANNSFSTNEFKESVNNLKTTGANYVSLVIPFYQESFTSSTHMFAGGDTPTDQSVINGIQYAKSLGLKVALKPHLEVIGVPDWRAYINPTNRAEWFNSYKSQILRYASIAQTNNVDLMILGTELYHVTSAKISTQNTTYWKNLIDETRAIYGGSLTYNAQVGNLVEVMELEFWDKLDFISISAYFELAMGVSNPTVNELISSWNWIKPEYIDPIVTKFKKDLVFSEIGYRSLEGTHNYPYAHNVSGAVDLEAQVRLYDALFTYWKDVPYLKGAHLWNWLPYPSAGGINNNDYTVQNKPAQQTITKWFGGSSTTQEPQATEFQITATTNPAPALVNNPLELVTKIKPNGTLNNSIVDIEIYNSIGQQVFQKFYEGQNLTTAEKSYLSNWTPTTAGTYKVMVGIFNNNWSKNYIWNSEVLNISVGTNTTQQPVVAAYTITATTPTDPKVNQLMSFSTNVKSSTNLSNVIIDIEVYNSSWQVVHQKFFTGQNLISNVAKEFSTSFTPAATGEYTIMVGIFNNNWSVNHHWNANVKKFNVTNLTTTPIPTPISNITISNPTTENVSGVFPLKALIEGRAINTYKMFWSVDGGQLVEMNAAGSLYESWIDVSGWNWKETGPYTLKFVAKDNNGNFINEKSLNITIVR